MEDLTRRLEATEMEAQRLSDALEQMSAQKAALERDVASIQNENERLQVDNEALAAEKWELSAANADLQNRLQAVSYMQVSPLCFDIQGIPSQTVKNNLALREGRKDISDILWQFFSRKHMPILISELVFIKKKWEIMKNHNNS